MIGRTNDSIRVAIVGDLGRATVYWATRDATGWKLRGRDNIQFDVTQADATPQIAALEKLVADHDLHAATTVVAFGGTGTVAQMLRLPPMRTRQREQAVRTRLRSHSDGQTVFFDMRVISPGGEADASTILAVGVDHRLVRFVNEACRKARLRVTRTTVLAGLFNGDPRGGSAIELFVGECTTTIQLFHQGRLVSCRDTPVGRRDFFDAYQRPILTEDGRITLAPDQAESLLERIGIPTGGERELHPGVRPSQVWPLLNPPLQRLRDEVAQTLAQAQAVANDSPSVRVLAVPPLPGLANYLASELHAEPSADTPPEVAARVLASLLDANPNALDLRPPEERVVDRLSRPALVAGLMLGLVLLTRSTNPRDASAHQPESNSIASRQSTNVDAGRRPHADLPSAPLTLWKHGPVAQRDGVPPTINNLVDALLADMPTGVRIERVDLAAPCIDLDSASGCTPSWHYVVELHGAYCGLEPADDVTSRWERQVERLDLVQRADVSVMSSDGRDPSVALELRVTMR